MNYLQILVMGGGVIGYVIWAISIVTIALIVQNFVAIRRGTLMPEAVSEEVQGYFASRQYRDAIELTANDTSFLSRVLHAALLEAGNGFAAMERAVDEAADEHTSKLLRHIEWLNVIGNVSPMLGLLGTVWGMIGAFFGIAEAGGVPEVETLAGDIGIALVTTLLGLGVAIPALAAYAVLRNRIDALTSEAVVTSEELISAFRPGKKATGGQGG